MADIRTEALANTFLIPRNNQPVGSRSSGGRTPTSVNAPSLPEPAEGLQYVEGVTRDYYTKWADLKSFVNSAWSNFGIDVTKPDFSKPESIQMHEIYNKAVADLMFQGDQLKTSQKELSKILADQRSGKVLLGQDPSQGLVTQTSPTDLTTSTEVDPLVEQTNDFSKRRFFTNKEYKQAIKGYNETKSFIENKLQNDPQNSEYWSRQLESLQAPTKSTKIFAPKKDTGDSGKLGGTLLKKVSNVLLGSGDTWKRAANIDPLKLQTEDFRGDQYGEFVKPDGKRVPKVIDLFLFDPETKEIEIRYQDSSIPADRVSQKDALSVTRQLVSSNPRLGTLSSLDKFVETNSLLDEEGEVDPMKLVSKKMSQLQEANLKEISEIKPFVSQVKSEIKEELSDLGRFLGGGTALYQIPEEFGGGELEIQRGFKSGKFFVNNIKDLYPQMTNKEVEQYEKLSEEQVISLLTNLGILENLSQEKLQSGSEIDPGNETPEFDPDI
jgi:hypothetical protein